MAAIGVAHWPAAPHAFWVNLYWLVLLFAAAVLSTAVRWRGLPRVLAAEAVLAVIAVQALWSTALAEGVLPRPTVGERSGVSWTLAFASPQQAIEKTFARPDGWRIDATYIRVDLGARYTGDAGFRVSANGQYVGTLDRATTAESVITQGVPAWSIRVPLAVLAGLDVVRVELRPAAIDRRLRIAGQADPLIDRAQRGSSRFFDGHAWHSNRLDGLSPGTNGTYRIWLLRSWGEQVPAAEVQAIGG